MAEHRRPLSAAMQYKKSAASHRAVASAAAKSVAKQVAQQKASRLSDPPVMHSVAGAIGAMIALVLVYPLDNARTRAHVRRKPAPISSVSIMEEVIKTEGIGGLFSGMSTALIGVGVSWSVYYYLYTYIRQSLRRWKSESLSVIDNMIASFLAGVVSAIISNPIWVVNTREKIKQSRKNSFLTSLRLLVEEEGLSSLMAGVGPAIVLVFNPTIQFVVYERLKLMLMNVKQQREGHSPDRHELASTSTSLTSTELFTIGAISKIVALIATYPYQVVKSRAHVLQMADEPRDGLFRVLLRIAQSEGVSGLYRGFFAKVVSSALSAALMFV